MAKDNKPPEKHASPEQLRAEREKMRPSKLSDFGAFLSGATYGVLKGITLGGVGWLFAFAFSAHGGALALALGTPVAFIAIAGTAALVFGLYHSVQAVRQNALSPKERKQLEQEQDKQREQQWSKERQQEVQQGEEALESEQRPRYVFTDRLRPRRADHRSWVERHFSSQQPEQTEHHHRR